MEAMEKSYYWKTPGTALHYLKMFEVLGHPTSKSHAVEHGVTEEQYLAAMKQPLECVPAFKGPRWYDIYIEENH